MFKHFHADHPVKFAGGLVINDICCDDFQVGQPSLLCPKVYKLLLGARIWDSCDLTSRILGSNVQAQRAPPTSQLKHRLAIFKLGSAATELCNMCQGFALERGQSWRHKTILVFHWCNMAPFLDAFAFSKQKIWFKDRAEVLAWASSLNGWWSSRTLWRDTSVSEYWTKRRTGSSKNSVRWKVLRSWTSALW